LFDLASAVGSARLRLPSRRQVPLVGADWYVPSAILDQALGAAVSDAVSTPSRSVHDVVASAVPLTGWNDIPAGYSASFDTEAAPWWLGLWMRGPFIDRFAYPVMVRRGYGYLHPMPGSELGPITGNWKVR